MSLLFLLPMTPGPEASIVSGLPLSPAATAVVLAALMLAAFTAFFAPTAQLSYRWHALLAALIVAKIALSLSPAPTGWRASYWLQTPHEGWVQARFQGPFFSIADHRIDPHLDFEGTAWGLHFINDDHSLNLPTRLRRDIQWPLSVRWVGHFQADAATPFKTAVSANGIVSIRIDDAAAWVVGNPDGAVFEQEVDPGDHRVVIEYQKPAEEQPRVRLAGGPAVTITPEAAPPGALQAWRYRRGAAIAIGVIALVVVLLAFARAYAPLSRLVLLEVWAAPGKLAAVVFFGYFTWLGLQAASALGGATFVLTAGDDWLAYEARARQVVFNGLLMTDARGVGETFHHYPLYSYTLAAAHLLFGEQFSSVALFNHIAIGAAGFAIYFLLGRHLAGPVMALTLAAAAVYLESYHSPYINISLSDNLYLVAVLSTLAVAVAAIERQSGWLLWTTGVLTALASATRPSFMLFPPFFVMALVLDGTLGDLRARVRHAVQFFVGFLCGVAPFTLRNWLVAQKVVLIVSSFIMLPYFLYPPDAVVPHDSLAKGSLLGSLNDFVNIWIERPVETAWIEVRKVLFTLGFVTFGPPYGPSTPRWLPVWPLLFGVAWWLGRIPRVQLQVLLAFVASHFAAMVLAAPWTYGYKTILPLHLAFMLGAVFLLPHWGAEWWRARRRVPAPLPTARPTISVVLPTYDEKDSIRGVIEDFYATDIVSEVLVINNNAVAGTSEQVAATGAREIFEPRQGYGAAIRRGLVEASGDLIVVCEPDGSFLARDIHKLVAFADDFDVVYGSRTQQQFIWHGANMGAFLRWGNWAVAKYMEVLYNATSLTDVGCTMRLLRREVAERLRDHFRIDGSQFGPEMMVLTLKEQFHVIQVPVHYLPRVGESSVTGDLGKAFVLGLQMIWLITQRRLEGAWRWPRPSQAADRSA